MVIAVSREAARKGRQAARAVHGHLQWRTNILGRHHLDEVAEGAQAHVSDMDANGIIPAHFHEVDQFQVLVAGSGSLGRNASPLIALHYVDHHTAYGPINAGPQGLTIYTLRAQSDPRAIYLHRPDYKKFLKPTRKRYLLADGIALSTEPVLHTRPQRSWENLFESVADGDGLGAHMLRLGAGMNVDAPDPRSTGGQYYLIVNGSLVLEDASYGAYSTVYVEPKEAPLNVVAGPWGLETLVLAFPRRTTDAAARES